MSQSDIRITMPLDALHTLVWEAAGVGSGAVMAEAPQVVMPSEVINEALQRLLIDHDLPRRSL